MTTVRTDDDRICRLDLAGRSPAFFCLTTPLAVDGTTLEMLLAYARDSGTDVRLCLHQSPQDHFHSMLIVQHKASYHWPHRHIDKGETWHMVAGELGAFVFDDVGGIIDARRLSPAGQFLYRIGDGQFHTVVPLTDLVVYHESKPGPFRGSDDSIFAPWAPNGGDSAAAYLAALLAALP